MMQQAIAVRPEGREKNAPNFDSGASQGSVMSGSGAELLGSPEVQAAYLEGGTKIAAQPGAQG